MENDIIKIAVNRSIGRLLKHFIKFTGETFNESVYQSVLDYVNILSHVKGNGADKDLRNIMLSFDIQSKVVFSHINELHREYLDIRKQDAVLLDRGLPKCDNYNYMIFPLDRDLYKKIKKLIKKFPKLYNDGEASVKDVVDRSILFRVVYSDELLKNQSYREWRISLLLENERAGQLTWEDIVEKVSVKRKVVWKES